MEVRKPEAQLNLLVAPAEARALIERIASCRVLGRSPRLRDLLLDIGEHSLTGGHEELSEQAIGVRIFGRSVGYNSSDDNIVRASVRQLRLKLKEYFDGEGQDEPLVLEIPKGGYLAAFVPRQLVPPVELSPKGAPARRKWMPWAVAAIATGAIGYAVLRIASPPAGHVAPAPATFFAALFTRNPDPVRVILTDSTLVVMERSSGRHPTLSDYTSGEYAKPAAGIDPDVWNFLASRQITSLADVLILSQLYREHPMAAGRIEARYSRHVQTRDFKSGNFVILGSPVANPWTALFDSSLNFQFERGPVSLRNLHPKAGELEVFTNKPAGPDYARIALLPNLSGNGFVLLIAGLEAEGTEGAGEFLFRGDSLETIRKAIGIGPRDALPWCEFVLEIKTLQRAAQSASIIAARQH